MLVEADLAKELRDALDGAAAHDGVRVADTGHQRRQAHWRVGELHQLAQALLARRRNHLHKKGHSELNHDSTRALALMVTYRPLYSAAKTSLRWFWKSSPMILAIVDNSEHASLPTRVQGTRCAVRRPHLTIAERRSAS